MADCIIPLSSNETMRDTTTYEYINTYYDYDYISINTMRMFVVLRYWNMDSIYIYIYIYLLSCTYVYMHMTCVYMHCVCGHALHSGILERRYFVCTLTRCSVHFGFEAKKKKKSLFALVCFLNGLLTDERQIVGDGKKEQV